MKRLLFRGVLAGVCVTATLLSACAASDGPCEEVVLASDVEVRPWLTPTLAWDGRFLLATYLDAAEEGHLSVLDPETHGAVDDIPLGAVRAPRISVAPHGGAGTLLYTTEFRGTWMRPVTLH